MHPVLVNLYTKWNQLRGTQSLPVTEWARVQKDLRESMDDGQQPSIFFLPTHTWYSTNVQRPQQMARALAEANCRVYYYEPWDLPNNITKEGVGERSFIGVHEIQPWLNLVRWPEPWLPKLIANVQPDALVMLWPDQARFIPESSSSFVVYEMIDDHSLISGADAAWRATHQKWVTASDVMVTTADDLLGQVRPLRPDAMLLPNGVRLEDWQTDSSFSVPRDLIPARSHPVVIGYYGVIADWFDWDWWTYAAASRPDWAFVLIGPPYPGFEIDVRMPVSPNLFYLGPKPYAELPSYLAAFDVATIPFVLNEITHACSPLKLFEYMAAGKPIVASRMREIQKYQSVLQAESPTTFVSQLERALVLRNDPEYHMTLKREAEANTWRARARALQERLETVRTLQGNVPRRQQLAEA